MFGTVFVLTVLGVAVVAFLTTTASMFSGSVDRRRLERFALRQALIITPANGNAVIRYLATTRRWRGGLLYLVVLVSFAWIAVIKHNQGDINFLVAFSGWFVGAVVAEWRVDSLARGPRAAALLHRRRIAEYVSRGGLWTAVAVWVATPVLAVSAVVMCVSRSSDRGPAAATLFAAMLAGSAILLVVRRVLARPQPLVSADLLEADNAIRGRSLNVLMGSAIAIGGYLSAVSVGEVFALPELSVVHLAQLLGFFALPILGVIVARAPRRTPVTLPAQTLTA